MKKGDRVRFTCSNLGASERDDLHHCVAEMFGKGDEGVLAFPHPNQKPSRNGGPSCRGWWYVEVESKTWPGKKLYVGVAPSMFEVIKWDDWERYPEPEDDEVIK